MNIFVLDKDPMLAAQFQCDQHIVKTTLETAQILCSVFYHNSSLTNIPYKLTHSYHPCCIWARKSEENFNWLLKHFFYLLIEYTKRYKKLHKCETIYQWVVNNRNSLKFTQKERTSFVQAMPEKYRSTDVVEAYRNYYNGEKLGFAKWKYSQKPEWVQENIAIC